MLENLEKVMPPRVHLVSISPKLDEDNQLALTMTVAGDSRDRAIELARRMEESRRFAQTEISESRMQTRRPATRNSLRSAPFTFRRQLRKPPLRGCDNQRKTQPDAKPKQSRREERGQH